MAMLLCHLSELIFKFELMKNMFCAIVLLLSFVGYSQNPISFGNNKIPKNKFQSTLSVSTISPFSLNFNYTNTKSLALGYALEVYNPTTQLNDTFIGVNDTYYMTNVKSFPYYGFDGVKADSFNPYGTTDMGGALVSGLINFLISGPKNGF